MARRRHFTFLKHYAAMQMILSMEDENGGYPNVKFVKEHPTPVKVADFPGEEKEKMLKYLIDMFNYVDPEVYETFHKMLSTPAAVASTVIDENMVHRTAKSNAAILQRTTDIGNGVALWSGDPPHPCFLIMREVVADLLD